MSRERVNSALNVTASMMMYYYDALVADGCLDPKQEMATELPRLIHLSEAQSKFVESQMTNRPLDTMIENMLLVVKSLKWDVQNGGSVKASDLTLLEKSLLELNRMLGGTEDGIK